MLKPAFPFPDRARGSVAALLLGCCVTPAVADVDLTLALASDYVHRGLVQTLSGGAYQASLEYQSRAGWFAGLWASRVHYASYDDRDAEIDYYLGYGKRFGRRLAVEGSVIHYTYAGRAPRDYDWTELQLTAYLADAWTVTWGIADDWWAADARSRFLEGTWRYPLPGRLTLDVTAGYQMTRRAVGTDYGYGQAGLSRPLGDFVVRLAYARADDDARVHFPALAADRWLASLTWRMPPP